MQLTPPPPTGLIDTSSALVAQAPKTPNPRANITLPAIPAPHAGTSYNPPASEHEALLRNAHDVEAVRAKQAAEAEAFKARIINARREIDENEEANGVPGMLVDKPEDHPEDEAGEPQDGEAVVRKMPERKTKQQRRKAEKQRAEVRPLFFTYVSFIELIRQCALLRNACSQKKYTAEDCWLPSTPPSACALPQRHHRRPVRRSRPYSRPSSQSVSKTA